MEELYQKGKVLRKGGNLQDEIDDEHVLAMHGFIPHLHNAFAAAQFLSGGQPAPIDAMRRALYQYDGDLEAAALFSYGMSVTEENRKALRGVQQFETLGKFEQPTNQQVQAGLPEAQTAADALSAAFAAGQVDRVKLGGKHSKGSLLARTPEETFLLKPGSGGQSSAAGASEDSVSQSRREAAFAHIAEIWELGDALPRADLILVDGHEYAAIQMLDFSFKNAEKLRQRDPNLVQNSLRTYAQNGAVHMWAVLDFVLGNPDRHGQNLMVSPEGEIKLIDHGSAFAGPGFDPANDRNSFVPYYLRIGAPGKFNELSPKDKLRYMPTVSPEIDEVLRRWVDRIDASRLQQVLQHFGVETGPTMARLAKVKSITGSISEGINRYWVTT